MMVNRIIFGIQTLDYMYAFFIGGIRVKHFRVAARWLGKVCRQD